MQGPEDQRTLTISVTQTEIGFDDMEGVWKELADGSNCTIYQSFEWQRTWWKYFGENRPLHCLVCKDKDNVVGILPLFKERVSFLGLRVATVLKFVGSGISDYLEPIVLPGYEESFLRAVVDHLRMTCKTWDVFEISDASESSPLSKVLMDRLRLSGLNVYAYEGSRSSQVPLPSSWDVLLQQLGRHTRHELKRKTQKLKENPQFEMETFGDNVNDTATAIREVAAVHGERWKSLGYDSVFDDATHLAFHTEVAKKLSLRGWLKIYFLKVNGIRVAASYDFQFRKRVYVFHHNAYGPDEIMKYSPGYVLHFMIIKEAIECGMEVYDMLRGNQGYKATDFKSVQTGNWLIRAVSPSGSGTARLKVFVATELLKKIPIRLGSEYHEFKRYVITQRPSVAMTTRFLISKIGSLRKTAVSYFSTFLTGSRRRNEGE
jgi:CelD/BcsL family acetyltransferase involved in cellulose biosynthesis